MSNNNYDSFTRVPEGQPDGSGGQFTQRRRNPPSESLSVESLAELHPETLRKRRGHRFYPPKRDLARIPSLDSGYKQPIEDQKAYVSYFTNNRNFYVLELDQQTGEAFGVITDSQQQFAEPSRFNLPELEKATGRFEIQTQNERVLAQRVPAVERDCHFDGPKPLRDLIPSWNSRSSAEHGG
ncbi:hypothetical protein [Lysinibacter cavernae]|uniref:hypothetical protein n=1 Tax=Lysinibacter cavernae TaxID=1640652 RepID=UPI00361B4ED1